MNHNKMTAANIENNKKKKNKNDNRLSRITILRESQIMKIHYITGVAALFVVAIHIMMRLIMPYNMSLEFENVVLNYKNIFYALLLESILILIAIHGFNGLRVILLELRQNEIWEKGVNILVILGLIGIIAYGTRTIIIANGFSLG
ncbi:MAG TPA: succinate dehydrogenase [Nitrososphaeraceae archaeon]|jgi:succinate dehydrogenase / fumarate reductase membrane anchor subunit|nr:succinate dehydrogenase [Nitrososphaeraceae archaeon]HEU5172325.1 succinate dehydrogenase [Nitrososphaeraceae archaeon]